jgi:integrase
MSDVQDKASFIWSATGKSWNNCRSYEYQKVILPLTVPRCPDFVPVPTMDKVLKAYEKAKKAKSKTSNLCSTTGRRTALVGDGRNLQLEGWHHLDETIIQKTVKKEASRAGLTKRATCHTFRHSFVTHLHEDEYDIRTVQEFLEHKDVRTTMIYTPVLNRGPSGVVSPLDKK